MLIHCEHNEFLYSNLSHQKFEDILNEHIRLDRRSLTNLHIEEYSEFYGKLIELTKSEKLKS